MHKRVKALISILILIFAVFALPSVAEGPAILEQQNNGTTDAKTIECVIVQALAKENHPPSMKLYGDFLTEGKFCPQNIVEAINWYEKAFELSFNEAGLELARIHLSRESEQSKGLAILEQLAVYGESDALAELGSHFAIEGNFNKAAHYLQHPLLKENQDAQSLLGIIYLNEGFSGRDTEKGLSILLPAAEMGSEFAQFHVGLEIISQGSDLEKGIVLIEQAAQAGLAQATNFLAQYYREIKLTKDNAKKALYWSIQSALYGDPDSVSYVLTRSGNNLKDGSLDGNDDFSEFLCQQLERLGQEEFVPAMEMLGNYFANGHVCNEDLHKAQLWLQEAYKRGSYESGFNLASLISNESSLIDKNRARMLLKELADNGHALSANVYAVLVFDEGNLKEAKKYFEFSAREDNALPYYNLARIYANEDNALYDKDLAIKAFKIASEMGHLNSKYHYGRLLLDDEDTLKKGQKLITEAAKSGDAQAQFALGHDYSSPYEETYDLHEARYWLFKAILSGIPEAKYFLADLFSVNDKSSTEFSIATTLMHEAALDGNISSALAAAHTYFYSAQDTEFAIYYLELALNLTKEDPEKRLGLFSNHYSLFIDIFNKGKLSEKIESLLDEYVDLAKKQSSGLYKAYYAKYLYFSGLGNVTESKLNISLAIQEAEDARVKEELLNIFRNGEVPELGGEFSNGTLESLTREIDRLYLEDSYVNVSNLIEKFATMTLSEPSDELSYFLALENISSYALFYDDYKNSALAADIYLNDFESLGRKITNPQRNAKMEFLSWLFKDYLKAQEKLELFSKNSQSKTIDNHPQIARLILEFKLNLAHGYTDLAKKSVTSAFTLFISEIADNGVCYSDFGLRRDEYFKFFNEQELFYMAKSFAKALKEASQKHSFSYLQRNCGSVIEDYSDLINTALNGDESEQLKADWFELLLKTHLYGGTNSQKRTLINLATLESLEDEGQKSLFKQYIQLSRELDDLISEKIAKHIKHTDIKPSDALSEITKLSLQLKALEESLNQEAEHNPLNPYNFTNFSVENLRKKILPNEGVIIIAALGSTMSGFYIDRHNFNVITTNLTKEQYQHAAKTILSSVEQGDVSRPLDLRPFAYEDALGLYDAFFSKFETLVSKRDRVLVISQGTVQLPLNIMPTSELSSPVKTALDFNAYRETSWFLEDKEILYLPNINMLLIDRSDIIKPYGANALGITPYWDEKKNSFSLPKLTNGFMSMLFQGDEDVVNYQTLPSITETFEQIESLTKSLRKSFLLGKDASKQNIISELENTKHDVVVFSTHALANSERIEMPSLVVREDNINSNFTLLTTRDITQINLNADWVFLIGCNTGKTNLNTDFLSLADSFVLAGAKRVVMTDWPIEAKATARFAKFFGDLPPDISFTKKITTAQKALRDDRSNVYYAHPMFWGGFRVIGYP